MKEYDIWMEGYYTLGGDEKAQPIAKIVANSFDEAINILNKDTKNLKAKYDKVDEYWRIWGCRLFDNEIEARKSFG